MKPSAKSPQQPLDRWEAERALWEQGFYLVAGIDEVGRGPLAGPVVAAAVILPPDFCSNTVKDSKVLSPSAREKAFLHITTHALAVGIGKAEAEEIDRINILQATYQAMRRAVAELCLAPDSVLVDGLPVPDLHNRCQSMVKGDARSVSIAAASIVAKVTRDNLMANTYHPLYPEYDFDTHKGYPTAKHLEALRLHGACPIHRRSFAPVANCLDK